MSIKYQGTTIAAGASSLLGYKKSTSLTLAEYEYLKETSAIDPDMLYLITDDSGNSIAITSNTTTNLNGVLVGNGTNITTKTVDDTPTQSSDNLVKSGGVYSALSQKQNTLTFDNVPTDGSNNPVKSDGLYLEYNSDSSVYGFRKTGGGVECEDTEVITELTGGTVAWNQLVSDIPNATLTINGISVTESTTKFSIAAGTSGAASADTPLINLGIVVGHKYFISGSFAQRYTSGGSWAGNLPNLSTTDVSTWVQGTIADTSIWDATDAIRMCVYIAANITYTAQTFYPQVFDLTQMFGSTVADYIYTLEQGTAGAGVAFFRSLFPNAYYAYNAGQLISMNPAAHVTKDSNSNVIGSNPFGGIEIRGVPQLVNNALTFDGDSYKCDGQLTRKYGIVDLGTLTWSYQSNYFRVKEPIFRLGAEYGICGKYYFVQAAPGQETNIPNQCITISTSYYSGDTYILIKDLNYSDAATFKSALSGCYFVSILATPTTESADPFTSCQVCDSNGTEEWVDAQVEAGTRDVSMPVQALTKYPVGYAAKVAKVLMPVTAYAPIVETNAKAEKIDLTNLVLTGTTNTTGSIIAAGTYFYLNNTLVQAKTSIASGATFTLNTNYEVPTAGALNALKSAINTVIKNDSATNNYSAIVRSFIVDLTTYTTSSRYTAPCDGFAQLVNTDSQNGYISISDSAQRGLADIGGNAGGFSTFVRRGMQLFAYGDVGTAQFLPIEYIL